MSKGMIIGGVVATLVATAVSAFWQPGHLVGLVFGGAASCVGMFVGGSIELGIWRVSIRAKRLVGSACITAVLIGVVALFAAHLWLVPWAMIAFACVALMLIVYSLWNSLDDEADDSAW